MKLKINDKAPDFLLPDEKDQLHKLSDYKGKFVVLYFYPRDNTSGCTTEACNFRDDYSAYKEAGVEIIGISPDSPESHTKFKEKHQLPFTLLADNTHEVCEAYGVWAKKNNMGREYYGVLRTTFLIDREGLIVRIFEGVKPAEHSKEVLAEIAKLT